MEKLCLIVSGGEFSPIPEELRQADYVIACDCGYKYAARLELKPDVILGDFDSAPPAAGESPVLRFPTRKDDTDTMLAIRHALDLGYRDIAVCCCFGGRLDHTLANLQSAAFIVSHGGRARLVGAETDAWAFTADTLRLPKREGWSLSLFALSDCCEALRISGTKYDCENVTLRSDYPLGVSNAWQAETAEISVGSGILLVLQSRLRKGEHI